MKTHHTDEQLQIAIDEALHKVDTASKSLVSQRAETTWIEWHGGECPLKDEEVEEWEYKMKIVNHVEYITNSCESPSSYNWNANGDAIIAYRVTKWREGFGPAVVDLKAKLEEAQKEIELLKKTPLQQLVQQREREVSHWCDMYTVAAARAEKAEAELAMSEAGGLRWNKQDSPGDIIGWRYANEPALGDNKNIISTDNKSEGVSDVTIIEKPWIPEVGDVVILKSSSPKMTIKKIEDNTITCLWFDNLNKRVIADFPAATLRLA